MPRGPAVVALFEGPEALLAAIPRVRERGVGDLQAFSPYPVHGLPEVLGEKRSPLGKLVFGMGALGALLAMLFQWWTSAVDYPVSVGGKPLFSWQAFVPILFEVLVLFAAFTAGLGMLLALNRLPFFGHPMLRARAMAAVTRDRFALMLERRDGRLDLEAAKAALADAGGRSLEVIQPEAGPGRTPAVPFREIGLIAAACVVAGLAAWIGIQLFAALPPMNAMTVQAKAVPYRAGAFFADGMAMRPPAEGTVARGRLPMGVADAGEAGRYLFNPLPRSRKVFLQGRSRYQVFCRVCHGPLGTGEKALSGEYRAQPANLQSGAIRDLPDGHLYYVISRGKGSMAGYAADMEPEERWAVIHYVRALQRSQDALEGDLP